MPKLTIEERNKKIIKLKDKGKSFIFIGKKFNITDERVRQIYYFDGESATKESVKKKMKYFNKRSELLTGDFMSQIIRLSKQDRRKEFVEERMILIKLLRNEYNFKFSDIAYLLERDLTSIKNLYNKDYEENINPSKKEA